jgi:hypothetical protein
MLNPWFFGLEAVQLGWRAQTELALKLMRTFAGGEPTQTSPNPDPLAVEFKPREDIRTREEVLRAPAGEAHPAIDERQETPVVTADLRHRKASKILPASKKSPVKAQGGKRAAAASQKSATKVRRSARKKR